MLLCREDGAVHFVLEPREELEAVPGRYFCRSLSRRTVIFCLPIFIVVIITVLQTGQEAYQAFFFCFCIALHAIVAVWLSLLCGFMLLLYAYFTFGSKSYPKKSAFLLHP